MYVPLMGLSIKSATIMEGNDKVFANGQYVPGTPGVTGANIAGNSVIVYVSTFVKVWSVV